MPSESLWFGRFFSLRSPSLLFGAGPAILFVATLCLTFSLAFGLGHVPTDHVPFISDTVNQFPESCIGGFLLTNCAFGFIMGTALMGPKIREMALKKSRTRVLVAHYISRAFGVIGWTALICVLFFTVRNIQLRHSFFRKEVNKLFTALLQLFTLLFCSFTWLYFLCWSVLL